MVRRDRRGQLLWSETPAMAGSSSREDLGGPPLPTVIITAYRPGMTLPPDQPPSPKPKVSAEERQARQADRVKSIRLRVVIGAVLDCPATPVLFRDRPDILCSGENPKCG